MMNRITGSPSPTRAVRPWKPELSFRFTTPNSARSHPVDVRLNNVSQLAECSKRDDSRYFLKEVCHIDYVHLPVLAPSADFLAAFGKHKQHWLEYELAFLDFMRKRDIEKQFDPAVIKDGCLLCSGATPHYCHRRLVLNYLKQRWGSLSVQRIG